MTLSARCALIVRPTVKRAGLIVLAGIALAAAAAAVAATCSSGARTTSFHSLGARRHAPLRGLPPRRLRDERGALSGRLLPARAAVDEHRLPGRRLRRDARSTRSAGRRSSSCRRAPATATPIPSTSTRAGQGWDTAIAGELPRVVDAPLPHDPVAPGTRARRRLRRRLRRHASRARAPRGVRGGRVVERLLPSRPTRPGTKPLDLGSDREERPRERPPAGRRRRRDGSSSCRPSSPSTSAADDWRFSAENEQLNQELSQAGIPHVFRLYAGGHDQRLWQRYAPAWLALALAHLAPAR